MSDKTPIINASEHAWVINDPAFPIVPEISVCPKGDPKSAYSGEHLLAEMKVHGIDKTVISHVCYYGRINDYTVHCVRNYPDKLAGFGLLVGHRLYAPGDPKNPERLWKLMKEDGLSGLRISPIYDRDRVWFNDPEVYPLWEKAQALNATFNIFLGPEQIPQVADMAQRFPGVNVVIDHMAMINIGRPDSEGIDPLCGLASYPNVYARTSLHNPSREQMPYRDVWPYLRRLYDAFGPQRLVYANFFEFLIMKDMIPFFTEEDKAWILGKTADRLYFQNR
jgi:predicted TIM-barrel fold metal-dependent hydrolase